MIERPAAPQRPPRRDWFAPAIVAGSLLLHGAIVALLLWAPRAEAAREPTEIPIEVVQMPPAPEKPKPPPPKQVQAKQEQAKQEQAKPPASKSPEPKPAPKTAAKAEKPSRPTTAQRMEQLIGPMPAIAMPSLTTGDNPLDDPVSYRQLVLSRVAKQKREDRHDGIPGHAVIAFAIGDHGEVVRCEVREKSVDPKLDAEAVAMVYRGAPYPVPPPGAERSFSFGLAFHTT